MIDDDDEVKVTGIYWKYSTYITYNVEDGRASLLIYS